MASKPLTGGLSPFAPDLSCKSYRVPVVNEYVVSLEGAQSFGEWEVHFDRPGPDDGKLSLVAFHVGHCHFGSLWHQRRQMPGRRDRPPT
jgi:hypothetical protein